MKNTHLFLIPIPSPTTPLPGGNSYCQFLRHTLLFLIFKKYFYLFICCSGSLLLQVGSLIVAWRFQFPHQGSNLGSEEGVLSTQLPGKSPYTSDITLCIYSADLLTIFLGQHNSFFFFYKSTVIHYFCIYMQCILFN